MSLGPPLSHMGSVCVFVRACVCVCACACACVTLTIKHATVEAVPMVMPWILTTKVVEK